MAHSEGLGIIYSAVELTTYRETSDAPLDKSTDVFLQSFKYNS
jgi:hypothetical protein